MIKNADNIKQQDEGLDVKVAAKNGEDCAFHITKKLGWHRSLLDFDLTSLGFLQVLCENKVNEIQEKMFGNLAVSGKYIEDWGTYKFQGVAV
ncbi:hypothetical protein NC651_018798 [Populus alba x Populus x berolinensis]|nr:hypothetical protein NC651_018798 [Populus alba x Populus x berolinensis]